MHLLTLLLVLMFALVIAYFCYSVYFYGGRWVANPYNPRISSQKRHVVMGTLTDRDGTVLAYTDEDGRRRYNGSAATRKAVCQVVGDSGGKVSTGADTFHAQFLLGFRSSSFERLADAFTGTTQRGDDVRLTISELGAMRRGIGMIFQHFNLLDRSTVFENIAYPLRYTGMKKADMEARVFELLDLVDLRDKADVYPSQLSGGQKQRVAIARALANKPRVLLSDEATSALDPDATEAILNLLRDLNRKLGLTIVLITHEMAVIKSICRRVAVMENGRVVEEGDVYDVFAHPRAAITRRFVASASALSKVDKLIEEGSALVKPAADEKLVRLTFHKDCVGEHVISTVSREFGVDINIVLANVEVIEDNPLGGMVALLGGGEKQVAAALQYLNENHVYTEVIADGSI